MVKHSFSTWTGESETAAEVEIPDSVVSQASKKAYETDRPQIIGLHPYFGWVYRDAEDESGIAELGCTVPCDSFGIDSD